MTAEVLSLIITAALLALIIFCVFHGWKKGGLRILFTTFSFLITILISSALTEPVSNWLMNSTALGDTINEKVSDYVDSKIADLLDIDIETGDEDLLSYLEEADNALSNDDQTGIIDSLILPRVLKNDLSSNNTAEKYVEMQVESFGDYLKLQLSTLLIRAITFLILLILIHIIIRIILRLIRILEKIPILHGVNKLFGIFIGIVQALLIIWTAGFFVSILIGTGLLSTVQEVIYSNVILEFFYENNLLLAALSGILTAI